MKIVLFNNAQLGLVRQQQELFYDRRFHASQFALGPDFAAIAEAFHVRGCDLTGATDPLHRLLEALAQPGPGLINVPIGCDANVLPMVPPGGANREMIVSR